jgi:signal peptidase I
VNLRGTASLLVALTVPLGGAVALRGLVGHPVVVQGPSMKPLLRDGSLVWVDRLRV